MSSPASRTLFGQLVVGPPGSGKTVYANSIGHLLTSIKRPFSIINLDPANHNLPYPCAVDIKDLITIEDAMEAYKLGPNGGLLYCIEFLERNMEWLKLALKPLQEAGHYLLIDCPGQVELYTVHASMRRIVEQLNAWNVRLCCVHLVDSLLCRDRSSFIAAVMLSLSTSLRLELPHLNVLTKIDLLPTYGELDFNIDFYTDVLDLRRLTERDSDAAGGERRRALDRAIVELIDEYALVGFETLDVQDKESALTLLAAADKALGFVARAHDSASGYSVALATREFDYERAMAVQERVYAAAAEQ